MITRRRFAGLLASWPLLQGPLARAARAGGRDVSGPVSDHFDGQRFFNPGSEAPTGRFGDFLRWQLTEAAEPWPDTYPSPYQDAPPSRPRAGDLRVTLVGHATFLIQLGGLSLLTDPIWSERASPVPFAGPRRYNPPGIAFDALPRIDAVLVSHNHYDHLDLPTLARLWQRDRPRIVAPLGNDAIIRAHDPGIAVTPVDWGDRVVLGGQGGGEGGGEGAARVTATAEPVHHWSARGLGDRNHALWAGYVLAGGGRRVFFAGDTGFDGGRPFRDVAARHGRIDLALLPIGAYEPRWFMRAQHMNPDDAVQALACCAPVRRWAIIGARSVSPTRARTAPRGTSPRPWPRAGSRPHASGPCGPGRSGPRAGRGTASEGGAGPARGAPPRTVARSPVRARPSP